MTAVIGRTASRAAGSNQMTPARPDQLPLSHPPWPGPAAGTAARRSGVHIPVVWTDPCGNDTNCGSLLPETPQPREVRVAGRLANEGLRAFVT
jgi:hypothetical protein